MTTPPSLVIHIALASLCLTLSLPWYARIRRRKWGYSRRRLVVSSVGLVAVSLILVHGLLLYGFLSGFGWSRTFGDGYGPALPLVTVVAEILQLTPRNHDR